ncbi:MAG: peptidoglycan DD-metalloendopeptidase family protein [Thiobacillaceae bacterium]
MTERSAPSTQAKPKPKPESVSVRPAPHPIIASSGGLYTVQKGDTLYGIAFANNLDHRDLAAWNNLASVDVIRVDQVLRLSAPAGVQAANKGVEIQALKSELPVQAKPLSEPPLLRDPQAVLLPYSEANWVQANASAARSALPPVAKVEPVTTPAEPPVVVTTPSQTGTTPPASAQPGATEDWLWPARGVLKGRFGDGGGKGIDIVGERNTPVVAVAPGRVVYSGAGLRGYGRLLIIKHPGEFLSAYAHNQSVLVKEGDTVSAGQKIALMGDSDADHVKLHFEVRQYGRPLDPMKYLPSPP